MLIVSKFHDYYDVGMKLGVDKSVVYDRRTVFVEGSFFPSKRPSTSDGWDTGVLAFCGNFYPFVYYTRDSYVCNIIWDVEKAVVTLPTKKHRYYWGGDELNDELGIRRFFDRKYPNLEKIYHEQKVPVFAFNPTHVRRYTWRPEKEYYTLVLNPNLKDIEFYKEKHPVIAFQEIQMYLSGVLGSRSPEPLPVSDKLKAQAHGHDGKYSFKTAPGEPKRRKKK